MLFLVRGREGAGGCRLDFGQPKLHLIIVIMTLFQRKKVQWKSEVGHGFIDNPTNLSLNITEINWFHVNSSTRAFCCACQLLMITLKFDEIWKRARALDIPRSAKKFTFSNMQQEVVMAFTYGLVRFNMTWHTFYWHLNFLGRRCKTPRKTSCINFSKSSS